MDQDVTTMAEAPPADLAYLRMELIGKLLGAGVAPDAVPAQARKLEAYLVEGAKSAEARKLGEGVDYVMVVPKSREIAAVDYKLGTAVLHISVQTIERD